MHQLMEDSEQPTTHSTAIFVTQLAAFHAFDFLRIFTSIQFLGDRYTDQAFRGLSHYTPTPNTDADHYIEVSAPIILASAIATVSIKILNAIYSKKNNTYLATQDYVYALFSSSLFFFAGDLFSSTGQMPKLSLLAFIMISAVGILAMMAIFFKLARPISSDKMIFSTEPESESTYWSTYTKTFENPSKTMRLLNGIGGAGHIASLSTFFWVLNHAVHNGAAPLAVWQKTTLGLGALGSAIFGSRAISDHPNYYLSFLMAVIFLNTSAISYASASSLAYYINPEYQNKFAAIIVALFFALCTGGFAASHFQYDSEKTHTANQKVEVTLAEIAEKFASFFSTCNKCCDKTSNDQPLESDDTELSLA